MKGGGGALIGGGGRGSVAPRGGDQEELARNRGYLQHELVGRWNQCSRCEHNARYHRVDQRPARAYSRHDPSSVCEEFQPHAIGQYVTNIVRWERLNGVLYNEVEPEGVIIPYLQRAPISALEVSMARALGFDFTELDQWD